MTDRELRQLIRTTIEEMLTSDGTLGPTPAAQPTRRALVLFTGAMLGYEDALDCLRRIQDSGIQLDFVQTDSSARVLDQTKLHALGMSEITQDLVSDHPMLIIPTLTMNTAAKVAHGFGDGLATNLIQEFIMLARPIIAARTGACPDSQARRSWFPQMPEPYKEQLRRNLGAMASYGVRFCDARSLYTKVMDSWQEDRQDNAAEHWAATPAKALTGAVTERIAEPLISQGTVQTLPEGSVLRISRTARVTALARDVARARSIRIEQD